jgi:hypothetical protein
MKNKPEVPVFKLGDSVIVQRGRLADCTGLICRTCKYTGMLWLHLDKDANHDYNSVEFGPFFPSEFIFNLALQEEKQICLQLNT